MSALTYKAPIRVVSASTEPFKAWEKFDYWHQVCQSEIFRIECEALPGTHFDAFARGVATSFSRQSAFARPLSSAFSTASMGLALTPVAAPIAAIARSAKSPLA